MTLFALVLAIGIVVDDAIIIVENASYYIEKGMQPREATLKAMQELTGPVMGITLALVAVFLPAAFLPGIVGQDLSPVCTRHCSHRRHQCHQCTYVEARPVCLMAEAPRGETPQPVLPRF